MNGEQTELFGVIFKQPHFPRLRPHDVIRIGDRLGRIIRVTDCAAVVVMNRPVREFVTRFDKPVRLQPAPLIFRISVNSEVDIVNRKQQKRRKIERRKS